MASEHDLSKPYDYPFELPPEDEIFDVPIEGLDEAQMAVFLAGDELLFIESPQNQVFADIVPTGHGAVRLDVEAVAHDAPSRRTGRGL